MAFTWLSELHNPKDKTAGSSNDPSIHRSTYARPFGILLSYCYFQRTTCSVQELEKEEEGIKEIVEKSVRLWSISRESRGCWIYFSKFEWVCHKYITTGIHNCCNDSLGQKYKY